jgi:hypothetical protein
MVLADIYFVIPATLGRSGAYRATNRSTGYDALRCGASLGVSAEVVPVLPCIVLEPSDNQYHNFPRCLRFLSGQIGVSCAPTTLSNRWEAKPQLNLTQPLL